MAATPARAGSTDDVINVAVLHPLDKSRVIRSLQNLHAIGERPEKDETSSRRTWRRCGHGGHGPNATSGRLLANDPPEPPSKFRISEGPMPFDLLDHLAMQLSRERGSPPLTWRVLNVLGEAVRSTSGQRWTTRTTRRTCAPGGSYWLRWPRCGTCAGPVSAPLPWARGGKWTQCPSRSSWRSGSDSGGGTGDQTCRHHRRMDWAGENRRPANIATGDRRWRKGPAMAITRPPTSSQRT